ncbi:unnamed protein product [Caenorhabditis auriculariae]|uniref:Uncharacterized protein n=1 Tax=Caenorhabditis auriculariae TaxID=2777116 RepID=A0A8S1HRN9_9PELO|nr:unnamed protein product [Caenorhabditis auriculariae]
MPPVLRRGNVSYAPLLTCGRRQIPNCRTSSGPGQRVYWRKLRREEDQDVLSLSSPITRADFGVLTMKKVDDVGSPAEQGDSKKALVGLCKVPERRPICAQRVVVREDKSKPIPRAKTETVDSVTLAKRGRNRAENAAHGLRRLATSPAMTLRWIFNEPRSFNLAVTRMKRSFIISADRMISLETCVETRIDSVLGFLIFEIISISIGHDPLNQRPMTLAQRSLAVPDVIRRRVPLNRCFIYD